MLILLLSSSMTSFNLSLFKDKMQTQPCQTEQANPSKMLNSLPLPLGMALLPHSQNGKQSSLATVINQSQLRKSVEMEEITALLSFG